MAVSRTEAHPFILTVILVGVFIGMGTNVVLGLRTFIRIDTLFHIAVLSGLVAVALHYIFFRSWNRFFIEILGYSIFGWGNIIVAVLLAINYFFHAPAEVNKYRLKENTILLIGSKAEINIDDTLFADYRHMLSFEDDEINGKLQGNGIAVREAEFTTAKGYFGYRVLLGKRLYY